MYQVSMHALINTDRYFELFQRIRQLCGSITSKWLKHVLVVFNNSN